MTPTDRHKVAQSCGPEVGLRLRSAQTPLVTGDNAVKDVASRTTNTSDCPYGTSPHRTSKTARARSPIPHRSHSSAHTADDTVAMHPAPVFVGLQGFEPSVHLDHASGIRRGSPRPRDSDARSPFRCPNRNLRTLAECAGPCVCDHFTCETRWRIRGHGRARCIKVVPVQRSSEHPDNATGHNDLQSDS